MYYLLNYIPCIAQTIFLAAPFWIKFPDLKPAVSGTLALIYLSVWAFGTPIYLLLINSKYIMRKILPFWKIMVFMQSVNVINIVIFMVVHKVLTGYFVGDIPEQLYGLLFVIPAAIIIFGTLVMYFKRR